MLGFSLVGGCKSNKTLAPVEVAHGIPGGTPYQLNLEDGSSSQSPPPPSAQERPLLTSHSHEALPSNASDPHDSEKGKDHRKNPDFIVVKQGDTLYSIANQYNMSGSDIITLNALPAPYRLEVGQKIYLNEKARPFGARGSNPSSSAEFSSSGFKEFIWPVQGRVISNYGENGNEGVNLAAPKKTPVYAVQRGSITYVGDFEDFGNMILISHAHHWRSAYAHLDQATVQRGEEVDQGQLIGYVGQTGAVTRPQLHFELRKGADSVNPLKYLKE